MDRTPAMIQLIEIVRSIAANMTTGGEMRSEGTGPIEQVVKQLRGVCVLILFTVDVCREL